MARRRRRNREPVGSTDERQGGQSEEMLNEMADFSSPLSPLMGCPKHVLDRSRLEWYGALGIGILSAVITMNGLVRSLFLSVVLAMLIDVVWRSAWSHWWQRSTKAWATALLTVGYLTIAAILIIREHNSVLLTAKTHFRSEGFLRLLLFLAGSITALMSIKLLSLIKDFIKARRAEKLEIRKRFLDSEKGWLDYRVESEQSSERLHVLMFKMMRGFSLIGICGRYIKWRFRKTPSSATKRHAGLSILVAGIDMCSAGLEANLEEFSLTVDLFIESTEGHLKTSRQDYERLSDAHEYFKKQLKDIHEIGVFYPEVPKAFRKARGISQELTAAIDRQASAIRTHIDLLSRLEKHCARMTKLTEARRDQALIRPLKKPLQKFMTTLEDLIETAGKDTAVENGKSSQAT